MRNFARAFMFVAVLLVSGTACKQDQNNKGPESYSSVEQKPMFKGEDAGKFAHWVSGQIKYPEEAYKEGAQGRVTLRFVIDKKGKVKNVKVIKSSNNQLLDNEALRVLSMSPEWTPGKVGNKPVDVEYTFPVVFKLMDEGDSSGNGGVSDPLLYADVDEKPVFSENDPNAFAKWAFKTVVYPNEARDNNIKGRVAIQFTIGKDGKVKDVKVAKSSGSKILDDEAVRVVSLSPQWKPGKHKGEPVDVKFIFPFVFELR